MTISHNLVTNVSAWFFWNMVNFVDFSLIYVSQGSVATYVRCGGMSTQRCIANCLLSLSVKEFLKSVKIWQSYCEKFGDFLFLEHSVQPHCSLCILHFKKTKSDSILIDCRALWGHMNMIPLPNARSTGALVAGTANAFTATSCSLK